MTTLSGIITPTNIVTATSTTTMTNKTLTAPTIASANLTTALTLAGAAGTNGQVLTSAGSGLPSWTTPSAGALTFLSTVTASTSATVDIETTFNSTYDAYLLICTGITISSLDNFYCRLKIGGSYITTNTYQSHTHEMRSDTGTYTAVIVNNGGQINVTGNYPTSTAGQSIDFVMRIYNPSSTAFQKIIDWQGVTINDTPKLMGFAGGGLNTGTAALTGVRFFTGGGSTIDAGKFRLYGIANS